MLKRAIIVFFMIIIMLEGVGCMKKDEEKKKYTVNEVETTMKKYVAEKFGEDYMVEEVRPWIEGNTYLEKFTGRVVSEDQENSLNFEMIFDMNTGLIQDNAIVFELEKELNRKVKKLTKESFGENMIVAALRCRTKVPKNQWKGEVDLKEFIHNEKCWIFHCIAIPIEEGANLEKEKLLIFSEALVKEDMFGKISIYYLLRENYEKVKNDGFSLERLEELRRNGEVQQIVNFKIDEDLKIPNIDEIEVDEKRRNQ